jgi:hypothetical protein
LRDIASRFTSARVIGLTTIAAATGVAALAATTAAADAATVAAPTLAVVFTPPEIGVTDSTGIAYTITNPNPSGTLDNIAFVDTLPAFATIDNPVGLASSGCGSVDSIGAGPGNGGVGATGIQVKAGTPCVITLSVVGNSVGTAADTLSPLTYTTSLTAPQSTAPATNEAPATLTVIAAPTASITGPKNNAKYAYGAKVKATYACTFPTDAAGSTESGCLASDDLGNDVSSGGYIDTKDPGVHTLQVTALDNDSDSANASVTYTVLPNNIESFKSVTVAKNGGVKLGVTVPGPGTVKVTETHGSTLFATKTVSLAESASVTQTAKTLSVPLTPTAAGKRLLTVTKVKGGKKVKVATKVKVILAVTYTPKGGTAHKITKVLTLG